MRVAQILEHQHRRLAILEAEQSRRKLSCTARFEPLQHLRLMLERAGYRSVPDFDEGAPAVIQLNSSAPSLRIAATRTSGRTTRRPSTLAGATLPVKSAK